MRTREFKDTELGPIPKDWEVKRLGDQAEVFCDGDWIEAKDQSSTGFRLIQTGNVGEGIYKDKPKNKRYVSEKTFNSLRCTEIFGGDVLVSRLPDPIGRACIVPNTAERKITAVDCTIIRFAEYDPVFFVAFSQTKCYRQMVDSNMAGSTRMRISRNALGKILVPYPPLPEQRRIAAALGDVDKLIENLKKRVEKKKNLKRGAMQELLTGRRRLKGFTGAWVEKRLGEIGAFSKGAGISRSESITGDLPAVRYGEIYTHHNDYVRHYISRISEEVAEKARLTKRGDILFAGSGETEEDIGKSVSVLDDGVYAGGDLIIFSSSEQTDPIFWGYLLNLPYVQRQKTLSAQGGTVVHIRAASIASIKVRYPPLPEQRAIAAVLSDMDAEIANLEAKLKKMTLLKQGIMQDLLTGKVRLV